MFGVLVGEGVFDVLFDGLAVFGVIEVEALAVLALALGLLALVYVAGAVAINPDDGLTVAIALGAAVEEALQASEA